MKTEITGNSYENGKRVEIQKVTYDKSDDLYTLANLQKQYENITQQIDSSSEQGKVSDYLIDEKEHLESEILRQQNIVNGYSDSTAE